MGEEVFLDCGLDLIDQEDDQLFVQVGADISHGFDITAQEFEVDYSLHFVDSFIEASHLAKGVELLEIKLREVSFSGKGVNFLSSDFFKNHIVGVIGFE